MSLGVGLFYADFLKLFFEELHAEVTNMKMCHEKNDIINELRERGDKIENLTYPICGTLYRRV